MKKNRLIRIVIFVLIFVFVSVISEYVLHGSGPGWLFPIAFLAFGLSFDLGLVGIFIGNGITTTLICLLIILTIKIFRKIMKASK